MSCRAATITSPEHLEQAKQSLERLEQERILSASVDLGNARYKTDFIVPDMHCAGCIGTIERGLASLAPVEQVRANLSMKTVSVVWSLAMGQTSEITSKLKSLGFDYHLSDGVNESADKDNSGKSLLLALAVAGFAAANVMLLSVSVWSGADTETSRLFHLISGMIAVPAVAFAGQPFFRSAIKALSARRLNMDVPISLAVLLALGMSVYESLTGGDEAYFDASVTLLFFLLIGRYLDHLMREKARSAVERLHSLSAKDGVLVNEDGSVSQISLNDIKPGMILRVFAGERFPVNGEVIKGTSDIDRSHVTGESEFVHAKPGEFIEAGSLNVAGSIDIKAKTTAQNSFLGEMQNMMEAAEKGRSSYIRIADRMAQIYAPAVHLLALITFAAWMVVSNGDWHVSLYTAIAVLIITCPCALGLAVPVAHVIGANRLLQNGILMRDGTALERLAEIDTVVFDKTGTLTTNTPKVVSVEGFDEETASILKSLAAKSNHPSASAVSDMLGDVPEIEITDVTEQPGLGIEGKHAGQTIRFGRPEWVSELDTEASTKAREYSISFVIEGNAATHFVTDDQLRCDAVRSVEILESSNNVHILSGDRESKVSRIAEKLGISNFHAQQYPAEKIEYVEALQSKNHKVLMVGDGINDAPALSAGHVSMVPVTASDIGRHSADFVFIRGSLAAVPFASEIAKISARTVRQNFTIAIVYNCIAVPLAMAGYVTPLFAAIAMSASSIAVVANSFRINFAKAGIEKGATAKPLQEADGILEPAQ